jgi:hypothetical protein
MLPASTHPAHQMTTAYVHADQRATSHNLFTRGSTPTHCRRPTSRRRTRVGLELDNIPVADKKLQWIAGATARWDGYLEFQRRPQPMLDWVRAVHVLT